MMTRELPRVIMGILQELTCHLVQLVKFFCQHRIRSQLIIGLLVYEHCWMRYGRPGLRCQSRVFNEFDDVSGSHRHPFGILQTASHTRQSNMQHPKPIKCTVFFLCFGVRMCVRMCVCVCLSVCLYVCLCTCVCRKDGMPAHNTDWLSVSPASSAKP